MHQILKRLELIKTSIAIEDEEIIELQTVKLSAMSIDDDVKNILIKLENHNYSSVVEEIDNYLKRFSGVVVYEDSEIHALRMELKILEAKLQDLTQEKNDHLNDINDFQTKYTQHLGDLIQKILKLKMDLFKRKNAKKFKTIDDAQKRYEQVECDIEALEKELDNLQDALDELETTDPKYKNIQQKIKELEEILEQKNEELFEIEEEIEAIKEEFDGDSEFEEFEEYKNDYNEFKRQYKDFVNEERYELDEDLLAELKKAYRKASKMCHPDVVSDDLKDQALKLMQELNNAYSSKNIKRVLEILTMLESGGGFKIASDTINDKAILKSRIEDLRTKIIETSHEIEEIQANEMYVLLHEIHNADEYFQEMKSKLQQELDDLQAQSNQFTSSEKPIEYGSINKDDEYWGSTF